MFNNKSLFLIKCGLSTNRNIESNKSLLIKHFTRNIINFIKKEVKHTAIWSSSNETTIKILHSDFKTFCENIGPLHKSFIYPIKDLFPHGHDLEGIYIDKITYNMRKNVILHLRWDIINMKDILYYIFNCIRDWEIHNENYEFEITLFIKKFINKNNVNSIINKTENNSKNSVILGNSEISGNSEINIEIDVETNVETNVSMNIGMTIIEYLCFSYLDTLNIMELLIFEKEANINRHIYYIDNNEVYYDTMLHHMVNYIIHTDIDEMNYNDRMNSCYRQRNDDLLYNVYMSKIEFLLNNGARVDIIDSKNMTVIDLLLMYRNQNLISLFEENNIDIFKK